jgi:hypothetical protein
LTAKIQLIIQVNHSIAAASLYKKEYPITKSCPAGIFPASIFKMLLPDIDKYKRGLSSQAFLLPCA